MTLVMSAIVLAFAGFLDRVRGGYPEGRNGAWGDLAKILIGAVMVLVVTPDPLLILGGGLGVWGLSWRQDNGWRGNWVRKDVGKRLWQPLRWGAIWSVPFIVLAWWEHDLLVYLVAAPLGALFAIQIATRLPAVPGVLDLRNGWAWSELITMPVVGVIAFGILALA